VKPLAVAMKIVGGLGVLGAVALGLAGVVGTAAEIVLLAASLALFGGGVVLEARARTADHAGFTVEGEPSPDGTGPTAPA